MSAQPDEVRLSWEEFLRFEQAYQGDERFELDDGLVVMMSGGTERHDLMTMALSNRLYEGLRGTPCRVFAHNRKVRTAARTGFYPDILVRCGKAADRLWEDDARFVIEVLSASNTPADRTKRLFGYRQLPSVEVVLFVDLVHRVVTVHRRGADAWGEAQVRYGTVELGPVALDFDDLWQEVDDQATVD